MKLTNKQREELWGEIGPYSQLNLKIETRILDDSVSRVFVIVESEINPFTFEFVKKNRDKFTGDKIILKSLLDNGIYEGETYGYVSCIYLKELIAEKDNLTGNDEAFEIANKILEAVQETIIKMHEFVMREIKK
ncbi:MAG: hypothetical protein HYT15_04790 [Candidatus Magasanikbacteria bacterium]|nr:hypothetical protein [Candidatus Magasanikbacteria bacterium]